MDNVERITALIRTELQRFAHVLGAKVIPKPNVSMWMILLPILFVFYMNDVQKYKKGRREFAEHYARTGERALGAVAAAFREGRHPDISTLVQQSDLSEEGRARLYDVYSLLTEHYVKLFQTDGNDWAELIRNAYGNKTNYLLFLNRLNRQEKELNALVLERLTEGTSGAGDIVRSIEAHSETIRREEADAIFS